MSADNDTPLLDSRGNPLHKQKTDREVLEALIRAELADAKDKLRQSNEEGLKKIVEECYKPKISFWHKTNAYTFAALVVVLLFGWLAIPEIVKNKTISYFKENLVGTALTNTVDNIVHNDANALIETRLTPLRQNVGNLEITIDRLSSETSNKQVYLASEQAQLREKIQPMADQVKAVQDSVDTAQAQAEKLRDEQRLMLLMNRGEVYDKDAIQELQKIAQGNGETAALARAMVDVVQKNLLIDSGSISMIGLTEDVSGSQYKGPFTSDELVLGISSASGSVVDGIVNKMGDNKLFVPTLVDLAHRSKDLWTINRISKKLKELGGVEFFPWDIQPLDNWWMHAHSNYTNWPSESCKAAMIALSHGKFAFALTNFESVLSIDPTADKSRAFAVECAIEIGDIQKAKELNKDYALQGQRWQKWANARLMLATNDVQQGTREFAALAKQDPTLVGLGGINRNSYMLRQIDWSLFDQLQETNQTSSTAK